MSKRKSPPEEKWDEPTILTEFTFGNLKLHEVIVRLIAIGYSPQEAHDLANEWADSLDDEHPNRTTILSGG